MCGSSRTVVALALATALAAALGPNAARANDAVDSGRRDLLAAEVARFGAPRPAPVGTSWTLIGTLFAATLAAAWFGTRLGLRGFAFGRLREKEGWREVTYRFRSEGPLRVRRDLLPRLEGLVGELEDLGAKVRKGATPGPPAVAFAEATPPVRFRRSDQAGTTATVEPPPPAEPPAPKEAEEPRAAKDPKAGSGETRSEIYRRARGLLADGRDPREVRETTGLKLAEIDLLRAAPDPGARTVRAGRPHLNVDFSALRGGGREGDAR